MCDSVRLLFFFFLKRGYTLRWLPVGASEPVGARGRHRSA